MACGSCGQSRRTISHEQAQAAASGSALASYTVLAPDGTTKTFDRYIDAAVYRRQVNGTLTTHT